MRGTTFMRRKSAVGGIVSRRQHGVLQRRSVNNSMSELQNYANFAGGLATGALGHIVGLNTHRDCQKKTRLQRKPLVANSAVKHWTQVN